MCHVGQSCVFEEGEEILQEMMGVQIGSKQIQRVSEYYGEQIERHIKVSHPAVITEVKVKDKQDPVYIMIDGSMVNTRDAGWKEFKLSRIFSGSQNIEIQKNRSQIMNSVYVSHLGDSGAFYNKLERYLIPYERKVILADGAKWIWNWAEDNYPGAIQILDLYHAMEKLGRFSVNQFLKIEKRQQWMEKQKNSLLENEVHQVIEELKSIKTNRKEAKATKEDVIRYFLEHEDRMQYKTYRQNGLLVGSGPIESAHRNVIQQRLKLSGQRWSIKGAQQIANLRVMKKSNNWECVLKLIKKAA